MKWPTLKLDWSTQPKSDKSWNHSGKRHPKTNSITRSKPYLILSDLSLWTVKSTSNSFYIWSHPLLLTRTPNSKWNDSSTFTMTKEKATWQRKNSETSPMSTAFGSQIRNLVSWLSQRINQKTDKLLCRSSITWWQVKSHDILFLFHVKIDFFLSIYISLIFIPNYHHHSFFLSIHQNFNSCFVSKEIKQMIMYFILFG